MVRYTGPKVKIVRRLGLLPGFTKKNPKLRTYTPGQHGKNPFFKKRRLSLSDDYKNRLIEKQKLRFNYGVTEKQLVSYYTKAKKLKESTGLILLEFLESRLDCLIYRLGFAKSIPAARQLISHKHVTVNQRVVNLPGFLCKIGDQISLKEKSKLLPRVKAYFKSVQRIRAQILKRLKLFLKVAPKKTRKTTLYLPKLLVPSHLQLDPTLLTGIVKSRVKRSNVGVTVKELQVVEYYSR
jgi:small subunit ribosomal protein S4